MAKETAKETGKSKAQRIQLDYYKQPDRLQSLRWVLALVALFCSATYAAVAYWGATARVPPDRPSILSRWWIAQASTGPVAKVHAAFEHDCQQCHGDQFAVPLGNDAWRGSHAPQIVRQIASSCTATACHQVSDHVTTNVTPAARLEQANCVHCHRDHLGRDHDLAAVADSSCVSCHAELTSVCNGPPRIADHRITSFASDHAEFASLARDRGHIRFDHYQHMQPGQVEAAADGGQNRGGFRMSMLSEPWTTAYRGSLSDPQLVQLVCSDCHQLRANSKGMAEQVADGSMLAYPLPIRFEQHCQACHGLAYEGQTRELLPLPHAASRSELRVLLRAKIEGGRLSGLIRMPSDAIRSTPIPGVNAGDETEVGGDFRIGDAAIAQRIEDLMSRCQKCHEPEHITDDYLQLAAAGQTEPLIPERWLLAGAFDHASHANLDCRFCHGQATRPHSDLPDSESGDDRTRVMIDGIESCRLCHRASESPTPAALKSGELQALLRHTEKSDSAESTVSSHQPTWASDRCVECHQYHWSRPHRQDQP